MPEGHDAGRPKAASPAAARTDNSSLGSKLSSFLNCFCPPSAPELRGWLRPANLPAFDCYCVHASCAVLTMNTAAGEGPPS